MMPCSCAASRASAICVAIGMASSSGIAPRAMRCDEIVALDELHHEGSHACALLEPIDAAMWGWFSEASVFASRWKRATRSESAQTPLAGP